MRRWADERRSHPKETRLDPASRFFERTGILVQRALIARAGVEPKRVVSCGDDATLIQAGYAFHVEIAEEKRPMPSHHGPFAREFGRGTYTFSNIAKRARPACSRFASLSAVQCEIAHPFKYRS
jgi:hypothetical protein